MLTTLLLSRRRIAKCRQRRLAVNSAPAQPLSVSGKRSQFNALVTIRTLFTTETVTELTSDWLTAALRRVDVVFFLHVMKTHCTHEGRGSAHSADGSVIADWLLTAQLRLIGRRLYSVVALSARALTEPVRIVGSALFRRLLVCRVGLNALYTEQTRSTPLGRRGDPLMSVLCVYDRVVTIPRLCGLLPLPPRRCVVSAEADVAGEGLDSERRWAGGDFFVLPEWCRLSVAIFRSSRSEVSIDEFGNSICTMTERCVSWRFCQSLFENEIEMLY